MCNPPTYENCSKEVVDQFNQERDTICDLLNAKAKMVVKAFKGIKQISCNEIEGALYAFPRIYLTKSAIEKATSEGMEPDEYFCTRMLEQTGIITVPGCSNKYIL